MASEVYVKMFKKFEDMAARVGPGLKPGVLQIAVACRYGNVVWSDDPERVPGVRKQ